LEQADIVVIGAGSAGCVLADRLSADPRMRVLLLEAGGSDRRLAIRAPIGYGATYHDQRVNWRFHTEPCAGLDGRPAYWPRGKVLGGSSSINAMVWHRGARTDYEDWRAAGNPGWGWEEAAEAFAAIERRVDCAGAAEGAGPLWVSDRRTDCHPACAYFLAAAAEIGLPRLDRDTPWAEGVGAYPLTTRRGLRCSAADAFLRPALRRPNLVLRTGAHVERILFEGRRAVGVAWREGALIRQARAALVVLAAGAIGSPVILQLSGVGPGPLLQRLGLPVVRANEAVGGGLKDHLGINYHYRATRPTLNQTLGRWPGRIEAALRYAAARKGPLSLGVNQIGGIVRSAPDRERPDMQLYLNPVSYSMKIDGKRPLLKPDPWPGFILSFNSCRPDSAGRVEASAPDPSAPPRITPNYLDTERDRAEVLVGARLIGRLQESAGLAPLIAARPEIDPARASDEQILADFRARAGSVYHPCATCRMAPEEEGGVLDPSLRVWGVEGLRVADASAFPDIPSANTNAPTIMLAHRAAAIIAKDLAT
jgi:choline dehydrogenase